MTQQVDLDVLCFILNQFSKDVLNDCSQIIEKLLNSLNKVEECQNQTVISSIKVLLSLYEKFILKNTELKTKIPVNLVMKTVKNIMVCSYEHSEISQLDVLSVVNFLFKVIHLQEYSEDIEELASFYDHVLFCIQEGSTETNCPLNCLMFQIKILHSIYKGVKNLPISPISQEIKNKLRINNNLKEQEIFFNLIKHNDERVAIETLMYLIPEYVNGFENDKIYELIWKNISDLMTHSQIKNGRAMLVLCSVFDIYFENSLIKDKKMLTLLLEDLNFWKLMRSSLVEKDPLLKKQSMYVLKKTINLVNSTSENIVCHEERKIFYWDPTFRCQLYKIYSEIIIILEFLDEQQVHIIKPIFILAEALVKEVIECNKVNLFWILLIFHKALLHESIQIVRWGLCSLLKLPDIFFLQENVTQEVVELLVPTLNDLRIYYNNGLNISAELTAFFKKLTHLHTSENFFNLFIEKVCSFVWSAEALFFITHALSMMDTRVSKASLSFIPCENTNNEIKDIVFWGEEEICRLRIFVLKAFKTHNKMIRTGIQCQLLNSLILLTNVKEVSFKNIILLMSSFSTIKAVKIENKMWKNIIAWLKSSYSKQDAEELLDLFQRGELGDEFNDSFTALMFILIYYAFEESDANSLVIKQLKQILSSFKDVDKRPYCESSLYDRYLSIICCLCEANVQDSIWELIKRISPFMGNATLYIQTKLRQISTLQDFYACQLYLKTFEKIVEIPKLFQINFDYANNLCEEVLRDLEECLHSASKITSVGLYWRIRLLNILLKFYPIDLRPDFMSFYSLMDVNEPLKRDKSHCDQTKDLQTLWGRLNSEFLEGKWKITEYLFKNKLVSVGFVKGENGRWISEESLLDLCSEALNSGTDEVLEPIMSILGLVLPGLEISSRVKQMLHSIWKLIMERKKTEKLKLFVRRFVDMLFREEFILKGDAAQEILLEFSNFIFSYPSLSVVNILMKRIQQIPVTESSTTLLCDILGTALIFGPVPRKDDRLTITVCSHIEILQICPGEDLGGYNLSCEIRARAVQKILTLDKKSPKHEAFAKTLVQTLFEMEKKINGNRNRYFGDSHTHRIKNRQMQALLVLEPIIYTNKVEAKNMSDWLYLSLMTENLQPSVRYLQEWLLIRLLYAHSELRTKFWDYFDGEIALNSKRGLCSLVDIAFHLCKIISSELSWWIDLAISKFFCLCMHQNFEVRLCAMVALYHLHMFTKEKKLNIKNEYHEKLFSFVSKVLKEDPKPLEDYSLQTIYHDLPKAANVAFDEWISVKMFKYCGVDITNSYITLGDTGSNSVDADWRSNEINLGPTDEFGDERTNNFLSNYQKKIIPTKLIPSWSEDKPVKKDGLIVVASLIDRIPNLGGLARTCEIFGASEYIVNSLKCIEDKQFTGLSVTAEKWITLKEVKTQHLSDYILEMKQNGYTVIGAEQALYSLSLGQVKFPKKSLVILGNEKEGIPPNLLPLLDVCVEIPQMGIIRSLNVHVTGALFMWEYAKQNHFT